MEISLLEYWTGILLRVSVALLFLTVMGLTLSLQIFRLMPLIFTQTPYLFILDRERTLLEFGLYMQAAEDL